MVLEKADKLKELAAFTIGKIVGSFEPELCPRCGSDEYYRHVEYVYTYKDYAEGTIEYSDFRGREYMCTTFQCDECEYCDD